MENREIIYLFLDAQNTYLLNALTVSLKTASMMAIINQDILTPENIHGHETIVDAKKRK